MSGVSGLRPAAGSLRSRLVVVVLVLTALGLVLAATAGAVVLRHHLVAQVDEQLAGAARFSAAPVPPPSAEGGSLPQGQLPSPFVLTRLDPAGAVTSQQRGTQVSTAPAPDLTGLTLAEVGARAGVPFDVGGVEDSAYSYRAVARPLPDGTGSVVLAISTESIDETTGRAALASLAVGVLILGLVGLLAGGVVQVGLRPLDEVERTAERIAAGDLSQRIPDMPAGTEVGRLAAALNGMLTQIETAFDERSASEDRLRRFVADASHELRTPLTTIRGYAELSRSGALNDDHAAQAQAVARIEEEAVRMGLLVDDLLLLARLDQRRPLERAEVDLVPLVRAAADALRAVAPDREVEVTGVETAMVQGDAARLRQVLDNLAANARIHTRNGTAVSFSVLVGSGVVQVVVTDCGPGMTEAELGQAFERFSRGDPSRTRGAGSGTGTGTGLGLSIAHAIVAEQSGRLTIVSSPGTGTTVTVALPALAGLPGQADTPRTKARARVADEGASTCTAAPSTSTCRIAAASSAGRPS